MAILDQRTFECFTHSEAQTERIGLRFGELTPAASVIALSGPMGAGKTHFARGFGLGWGAQQSLRSPTFTLVQMHRKIGDVRQRLYHIDLYRVAQPRDLEGIGLDEILDDPTATILIEWPDRAAQLLPPRTLSVSLAPLAEERRRLVFHAPDDTGWQLLLRLRKSVAGV